MFIRAFFSYIPAFFLVGVLALPVVDARARRNVEMTLGIAALIYGAESVVKAGRVETCGGNLWSGDRCEQHSVRVAGLLLWLALFAVWQFRYPTWPAKGWREEPDD